MSNDRAHAVSILNKAASLVGHERVGHGSVEESFGMIAELWSTHINHAAAVRSGLGMPVPAIHLTASDVLHMMADVKRVRALYGDSHNLENYWDNAGYIALAGMLAVDMEARESKVEYGSGPDADPEKEEIAIPEFLRKVK